MAVLPLWGHVMHINTHAGCASPEQLPAFGSNGLEKVLAKECAQESSKTLHPAFPLSCCGPVVVGIASCLGRRGSAMKSVTGRCRLLWCWRGEGNTHLSAGQWANGPFSVDLCRWKMGHKWFQWRVFTMYLTCNCQKSNVLSSLPVSLPPPSNSPFRCPLLYLHATTHPYFGVCLKTWVIIYHPLLLNITGVSSWKQIIQFPLTAPQKPSSYQCLLKMFIKNSIFLRKLILK